MPGLKVYATMCVSKASWKQRSFLWDHGRVWSHENPVSMFGTMYGFWKKNMIGFCYHQSIYSQQGYSTLPSSPHSTVQNSGMCLPFMSSWTSVWALGRWERERLTVCWQPFLFVIYLFAVMWKHISLLEFCEHCYMSYLESCPIGQIPKIVSSLGAKMKLFLNGILEASWWPLGPYFKASSSLTEGTDFYHSLPETCSWVCCDMWRLCLASGFSSEVYHVIW